MRYVLEQIPGSLNWLGGEGGQEAAPAGKGGAGHFPVPKAGSPAGCGHKLPAFCVGLPPSAPSSGGPLTRHPSQVAIGAHFLVPGCQRPQSFPVATLIPMGGLGDMGLVFKASGLDLALGQLAPLASPWPCIPALPSLDQHALSLQAFAQTVPYPGTPPSYPCSTWELPQSAFPTLPPWGP